VINGGGYEINSVALASTDLSDTAELIRTNQAAAQNITPASGDIETLVVRASPGISTKNVFEVLNDGGTQIFRINNDGDITVAGGETIVGSITFTDSITFGQGGDDTVTFGDATVVVPENDGGVNIGTAAKRFGIVFLDTLGDSGQDLTVATNLESNLNWTVQGGDGATETAGYTLDVRGGDGGGTVAGSAGAGGASTLRAGDGGDASGAGTSGAGGALTVRGGDAGTNVGGVPGAGGDLTIRGGNATDATINGGDLYLDSGSGSAPNVFIADTNAAAVTIGASGGNEPAVSIYGAVSQIGSSNQVSFAGNVDASNGLDVSGAALTLASGIHITGVANANNLGATGTEWGDIFMAGPIRLAEHADPGQVADKGYLYAKADGDDVELFYFDDNSNAVQITKDGAVNAGGTSSLQTAYDNGATITTAGSVNIAYTLTAGNFTVGGAGTMDVSANANFTGGVDLTTVGQTMANDLAITFGGDSDVTVQFVSATPAFAVVTKNEATAGSAGISLTSGNATTSGNTGPVSLVSGDATSGNSGDINLTIGSASGTAGKVKVSGGNFEVASGIHILPAADSTSNIGTDTERFLEVFTDEINIPLQGLTINSVTVGNTVTSANLDTLTDGSNADALHSHAAASSTQITATLTAGENLVAGDFVYIKDTDDKAWKVDADAEESAQLIGVAAATINADASGTVVMWGVMTGLSGLDAGKKYWVSATAGQITSTPPATGYLCFAGYALSATSMMFRPERPIGL